MSLHIRKIVTTLMATGMLLSSGVSAVSASRRTGHHYRSRITRVTRRRGTRHYRRRAAYRRGRRNRRYARKRAVRVTRHRRGNRRVKKSVNKRRARKPIQVRGALTNREVKQIKAHDAFVILKYQPAKNTQRVFAQNAKLLSAKGITYGVSMDNMANTAKTARAMVKASPKAAFYMDIQSHYRRGVNPRAINFAKAVRSLTNKPRIFYAGTSNVSKAVANNTRQMYNFSWTSRFGSFAQPIWRFTKGHDNSLIGSLLVNHNLHNTMPIELRTDGHQIYPMNNGMTAALHAFYAGNNDIGNRDAMASAMQQYDHDYEAHHYQGATIHTHQINKLANQSQHAKGLRVGASKGTKSGKIKSKNFNKYKQNADNLNSVMNYQHADKVNQGNTDGCEVASTKMAFNIMGLGHKTPTFYHMLKSVSKVYKDPEKGYDANPMHKGTGAGIYPQALAKNANRWINGNRKRNYHGTSTILTDNAFQDWHGGNNYGGRNYGKARIKVTNNFLNKIPKLLNNGHPIVYEGAHTMNNTPSYAKNDKAHKYPYRSDHVLILWGIKGNRKNPTLYYTDPDTYTHHHTVSWKTFKTIVNENDSSVARGPRSIIVSASKGK